jgi:hypothetical protein
MKIDRNAATKIVLPNITEDPLLKKKLEIPSFSKFLDSQQNAKATSTNGAGGAPGAQVQTRSEYLENITKTETESLGKELTKNIMREKAFNKAMIDIQLNVVRKISQGMLDMMNNFQKNIRDD